MSASFHVVAPTAVSLCIKMAAAMDSGISTESDTSGLRQRYSPDSKSDWDSELPYGGKVFLARKKKPDPPHVKAIEV